MKLAARTFVLLLIVASFADAQTRTALPKTLESLRSSLKLPAVGGVLFDSAKIGEVAVTGVRKLGDPTPVTMSDLWHVGSITKSFTSTLAGEFVERGQLSWSATLGELLGTERNRRFAAFTFAQVLSLSCGDSTQPFSGGHPC